MKLSFPQQFVQFEAKLIDWVLANRRRLGRTVGQLIISVYERLGS